MMNDRKLNNDKQSAKINAIEQLCKVIIECPKIKYHEQIFPGDSMLNVCCIIPTQI